MNKDERIESIKRVINTNNIRISHAKKRLQEPNCHNFNLKIKGIEHLEKENANLYAELKALEKS